MSCVWQRAKQTSYIHCMNALPKSQHYKELPGRGLIDSTDPSGHRHSAAVQANTLLTTAPWQCPAQIDPCF